VMPGVYVQKNMMMVGQPASGGRRCIGYSPPATASSCENGGSTDDDSPGGGCPGSGGTLNIGFIADFGAPGLGGCPYGLCERPSTVPLNSRVFPFMGDVRGCKGECCGYGTERPSGCRCSHGDCAGESEGESESICIGGGEMFPVSGPSGASCPSSEYEWDDRADGEKSGPKSSNDVCSDDELVIRLIPSRLGRFRIRDGPGSLSTVANEIVDMCPILCTSEDDIEWSSSNSLRRALAIRSVSRRQSATFGPSAWSE